MTALKIDCGFLPLLDCAPLVIAKEIGFAADEHLDLVLHREPTWSSLRDRLVFGQIDAAHMLAPVPIATSLGLGGVKKRLDVLSVLSVNGNVIGVSRALHQKMQAQGATHDFVSAHDIGRGLISAQKETLRIGVPFPFSMHAELVRYWLSRVDPDAMSKVDIRTVPPPLMAEAIAAGEVDAFSVGEPWGSYTSANADGVLILPGKAIWSFAPEKVLTVRHEWAEAQQEASHALLRAVWRSAKWLSVAENRIAASEILAKPAYLNMSSDLIEAGLYGRIGVNAHGMTHHTERFVEFFDAAATFPWRSQAAWIADRLARRMGLDPALAIKTAKRCFRSDVYRAALQPIGADLPGASEKIEGALGTPTAVSSTLGRMILGPDSFFDGATFDPD